MPYILAASFLNPSSTHSIMSSVPRVRQSISWISFSVGGVMIMATIAAKTDIVSMGSFFRNSSAFFIFLLPFTGKSQPAQYTSR